MVCVFYVFSALSYICCTLVVFLSPTGYPEVYSPIARKPEVFEDGKLKGAKKLSQATQSV